MSEQKKTILVVEDEPNLLESIKKMLGKENVEVLTADTGEKALEVLKSVKPDLVWLDFLLPGMNGFEVLKNIRESLPLKNLKVAVVSVSSSPETINKMRALGICDFIIKSENTLKSITKRVLWCLNP